MTGNDIALSGLCILLVLVVLALMRMKLLVVERVPATRSTRTIAILLTTLGAAFLLRWLLR